MILTPYSESAHQIQHLVKIQIGVAVIVALVVAFFWNVTAGLSMLFGVIVVIATGWHTRRELENAARLDVEQGKKALLKSAVIRFLFVLLILFSAYGLGLHLLWLAAGFFIGQLVSYSFFLRMFYQQQHTQS
ncbi:MAG: ATP synthase subunit I [Mariprofundaceae bacterium]|nr:ATP synthase subunit I [Mariprofundaceae bacterium]